MFAKVVGAHVEVAAAVEDSAPYSCMFAYLQKGPWLMPVIERQGSLIRHALGSSHVCFSASLLHERPKPRSECLRLDF